MNDDNKVKKLIANIIQPTFEGPSDVNYSPYLDYKGTLYKGTDQFGKLCRDLVSFGHTGSLLIYEEGSYVGKVQDIEERAKKSLRESKTKGLHYVKYVPFKGVKSNDDDDAA